MTRRMEGRTAAGLLALCLAGALAVTFPALGQEAKPKAQAEARDETKAQEPPPLNPNQVVSAVFKIENADVRQVADVLQAFRRILGGTVQASPDLKVIAVSGPKELVAACEEAIKKLDVPPPPSRMVDLTFYLLTATRLASGAAGEVPAELDKVCEQLKTIAGFKSFKLVDTMALRVQEGRRAEQRGLLPARTPGGSEMPYELGFDSVQISGGGAGARIHLNRLTLNARLESIRTTDKASERSVSDGGIKTDIEFGAGQKAVVGVIGTGGSEALILVVTG